MDLIAVISLFKQRLLFKSLCACAWCNNVIASCSVYHYYLIFNITIQVMSITLTALMWSRDPHTERWLPASTHASRRDTQVGQQDWELPLRGGGEFGRALGSRQDDRSSSSWLWSRRATGRCATFWTTPRMSDPWKREGKLVCNERLKIHLSLVLIVRAQ